MHKGHTGVDTALKELDGKALVYAGFDPTGDGLHLGHLGVLSILNRFKEAGNDVVAIIGTGTAFIGDPTGKNEMRKMLDANTIDINAGGIASDIRRAIPGIEFHYNDWLKNLNLQDFMREIGSRIPLNMLLDLSIVRDRLSSGNGITLMEAIYPVLQGYDMVVMAGMAKKRGIKHIIQVGGVDQTGNISMGIHLVNRLVPDIVASGVLSELIVTASGEKMGKSAGNALFLNPSKTDDLMFFDSIVSTPDEVIPSMIDVLMPSLDKAADIQKVKKALAIGITGWVRGDDAVSNILEIKSKGFDAGNIREFNMPVLNNAGTEFILHQTGLASSRSDARRLISNGGVKINGEKVIGNPVFTLRDRGTSVVLSKGKKNHVKINFV